MAVIYAHNRRDALEVYLSAPRCPDRYESPGKGVSCRLDGTSELVVLLDRLGAEAEHVGISQNLVSICCMHEVNPYTWLIDALQKFATHPARDVAQFTPRLWKQNFAANPLTSDIGKGVLEPAFKSAA